MKAKTLLIGLICSISLFANGELKSSDNFTTECKDPNPVTKSELQLYAYFQNDSIIIKDIINDQCCAEFELKVSGVINDTIYISFKDTATQQCNCVCFHNIKINAGRVPSKDVVVNYNGIILSDISEQMYPMVQVGSEWYVELGGGTLMYHIDSDITQPFCWNGKFYSTLLSEELYVVKSSGIDTNYIREENGKVYFGSQSIAKDCSEFLIYDFTASEGETVVVGNPNEITLTVTVDSVRYIKYKDDKLRKTLYLTGDIDLTWIEGVGNVKDPFNYWEPVPVCKCLKSYGEMGTLVCCYQEGELIYRNNGYSSCMMSSVGADNSFGINIYPNPAKENIYVNGINEYKLSYSILNCSGNILQQGDLTEHIYLGLPDGIYILSINDGDKVVKQQKLLIERK